jgi:Ni/Fe-hydrogenase subunit HybB-like protein
VPDAAKRIWMNFAPMYVVIAVWTGLGMLIFWKIALFENHLTNFPDTRVDSD